MRRHVGFGLAAVVCLVNQLHAQVQSALTYQGELRLGAERPTALYDFQFALFSEDGGQVGPLLCVDNVAVTEGRFTVSLDFGDQFSGRERRFLELQVRPDSGLDCSNNSDFETLSPRQELSVAPFASSSLNALVAANSVLLNGQSSSFYTNASSLVAGTLPAGRLPGVAARTDLANTFAQPVTFSSGTTTSGNSLFSGGQVTMVGAVMMGASGATAQAPLHVREGASGAAGFSGNAAAIFERNGPCFVQLLTPDAFESGVLFGNTLGGVRGSMIYNDTGVFDLRFRTENTTRLTITSAGDVGIGTTTPTAKLHVSGSIASPNFNVSSVLDDANLATSNILAGYSGNVIGTGVAGATISGGGQPGFGSGGNHFQEVLDNYGFVGGGSGNKVGDGLGTVNDASYGAVAGGQNNEASGEYASVLGGKYNVANGAHGSIGGGQFNSAAGNATVAGGSTNVAGTAAAVGGGVSNHAEGLYSVVAGGQSNHAGESAVVAGGITNDASGFKSFVGGGNLNIAGGTLATVVGGGANEATNQFTFIGGGYNNSCTQPYSVCVAGASNVVYGHSAAAVGGSGHSVGGDYAFVGGGFSNVALGDKSVVGGGEDNAADGLWSSVIGGNGNTAGGDYSFAGGRRAKVRGQVAAGDLSGDEGCFVWADSQAADFTTTGPDQFLIRAAGGVGIGTNSPLAPLHVRDGSSGVGSIGSSRAAVFERGAAAYVQLLTPTASESGLVFGNPLGSAEGGIIFNDTGGQDLRFRTQNVNRLTIDSTGRVGIGTTTPGVALQVAGTMTATVKAFTIDHPLDPEHKLLMHSCVESDEYKNLYDGIVTTDSEGFATITLPAWFEALNENFRYQLTVIDESESSDVFVWAKVVRKVADGKFTIRTARGGVEVSWQVTGNRKDAYVKAHPLQVEQDKPKSAQSN